MLDTVFFYFFALLTVGGGVLTIPRRDAIHSAVSLIVSLIGVAGLFLLQQAEFLFAVQIVLYVGGIMVLFLFVIMLVNLDESARVRQFNKQWWLALACVAAVTGELLFFVSKGTGGFRRAETTAAAAGKVGNTERIADVLFSQYLLPFELASVLLLAAVIGSVFVARKKV
jgi:NADH-quinone oxidoreductase subunit J